MSPRERILARRARFMAAAMTSLMGCSDDSAGPVETDAIADTRPQACLSDTAPGDTGAQPCLTADTPPDTNSDTAVSDTADTGPMPCLEPPLDSGPMPCLVPPEDTGAGG
jgi:hypothetical protein